MCLIASGPRGGYRGNVRLSIACWRIIGQCLGVRLVIEGLTQRQFFFLYLTSISFEMHYFSLWSPSVAMIEDLS